MSNLAADEFTPSPADAATAAALDQLTGDARAVVRLTGDDAAAIYSDAWMTVTDQRTGLPVQVRRADCGFGCRCAAEVRLAKTGR